VIRDDGRGFDPALVPDPTQPSHLQEENGRGLLLMRTFMDEVQFNVRGNQVAMVKRRERATETPAGAAQNPATSLNSLA